MCLSENEPGGPKRCDGHAEIGFKEAQARLASTITEQGDISRKLQPLESELTRHRGLAEHARIHGNQPVMIRELARIDAIEAVADPLRGRAKKLTATKGQQFQILAEKRSDFHATSTGLVSLQSDIDSNRIAAKNESLTLPEREFARLEAQRLQSIASKAKLRMDAEEQNRLENARKNGWEYQVKEVVPIAEEPLQEDSEQLPYGTSNEYHRAVNQFAADRGVTMYAQGTLADPTASEFDKYQVIIGNEDGKTVTIDLVNYTEVPTRTPEDPLGAVKSAPSRGEVIAALNRRYADQRDEPSFDKWIDGRGGGPAKGYPRYEELKAQWQASARERARLKKVLGDERFEKLATL